MPHEPPFDTSVAHRWFAVELNNRAWDLLEAKERTAEQDEMLIHAAHASCYHWSQIGTAANRARAECVVANAHALLGNGNSAVRHAQRCVQLSEDEAREMADWDLAFAYDCLARAQAASGRREDARQLKQKARELGDKIADAQDKQFFDQWHAGGNWHGIEYA